MSILNMLARSVAAGLRCTVALLVLALVALPAIAESVVVQAFESRNRNAQFLTTSLVEAQALETVPALRGQWKRSLQYGQFRVFDAPTPETVPVCRFYQTFAFMASHFFTAFRDECEFLQQQGIWNYEGVAFHVLPVGADGTCSAGAAPVYRRYLEELEYPGVDPGFEGRRAPKHVLSPLQGWRAHRGMVEGLGPDGVAFCTPVSPDPGGNRLAPLAGSTWRFTIDIRANPLASVTYTVVFNTLSDDFGFYSIVGGAGPWGPGLDGSATWDPFAARIVVELFGLGNALFSHPAYRLEAGNMTESIVRGCAFEYAVGPWGPDQSSISSVCLPFLAQRTP